MNVIKTEVDESLHEGYSEIADMNMGELNEVLKEQLKSYDCLIKTLNKDLLQARAEIKKHKEDKFHLQHFLLLQVKEVVKLEP